MKKYREKINLDYKIHLYDRKKKYFEIYRQVADQEQIEKF